MLCEELGQFETEQVETDQSLWKTGTKTEAKDRTGPCLQFITSVLTAVLGQKKNRQYVL